MPEVIGRYVTVFIPGKNKILTLCEVEVYGTSVLGMCLEISFPTFNFILCPNDASSRPKSEQGRAWPVCSPGAASRKFCVSL